MDAEKTGARRRALIKLVILLVFVAIAVVVGIIIDIPPVDVIRDTAAQAGAFGIVLFVLAYGVVTLTPIPKNLVGIAAGVIWGFGLGSLAVYLGALVGAAAGFVIGRALGRDAVERFTGSRVARVDAVLRERGLGAMIGMRLIPVLPFTVINYSAGLTGVSRRNYAIGTAVGIIPGTLAYVALGAFGLEMGWQLYLSLGILGVLTIVGALFGVRARKKAHEDDDAPAGGARVADTSADGVTSADA
ncbi:TVP38/TMEM64 family protein [Marisediminicola sp. LYQ134]|uniref:TVP38/TMEM64 family protein n=1 Tax=Marisediminicola sp. LYQ134 TaxID=3391061 RepID=UPI0039838B71